MNKCTISTLSLIINICWGNILAGNSFVIIDFFSLSFKLLFFKTFELGIYSTLTDESKRLLEFIDLLLIGVLVADDILLKSTDLTTHCLPTTYYALPFYT